MTNGIFILLVIQYIDNRTVQFYAMSVTPDSRYRLCSLVARIAVFCAILTLRAKHIHGFFPKVGASRDFGVGASGRKSYSLLGSFASVPQMIKCCK